MGVTVDPRVHRTPADTTGTGGSRQYVWGHRQNLHSRKIVVKMLHGRFVHVGKTLTDLQIFRCGLHQNAFGGRAQPGPAGGAIVLPQTRSRY